MAAPSYPRVKPLTAEEQYGGGPTPSALALLAQIGGRQTEQTRYGTEEAARGRREVGATLANAMTAPIKAYQDMSKYKYDTEEQQGKIDAQKQSADMNAAKMKSDSEEQAYLDTPNAQGVTPRQQQRENEMKQGGLKNQLTQAQIAAANAEAAQKLAEAKNPKGKEPSDAAKRSGAFAQRASSANSIIEQLEAQGYNPSDPNRIKRDLPGLRTWTLTPQDRQYKAAQDEWMASVLRDESGATISPSEFDNYRGIYFAGPNDDIATRAQRNARRKGVQDSMFEKSSGYASPDKVAQYTVPPPTPGKPGDGTALAAATQDVSNNVNLPPAQPRRFYSEKTNKTKLVYPDGREEILDGKR